MWNAMSPAELAGVLPKMGSQDGPQTQDVIVYQHYFIGSCDWFLTEYDPDDDIAFGFACLGDPQMAEWGYISMQELRDIKLKPFGIEIDRDLYWQPKPAREVPLIVKCGGCW